MGIKISLFILFFNKLFFVSTFSKFEQFFKHVVYTSIVIYFDIFM